MAKTEQELFDIAKANNPRIQKLVGHRGTGCRREYRCNYCGAVVTTDSAKWSPTKTALRTVDAHIAAHMAE